jgi:hypothetical protein
MTRVTTVALSLIVFSIAFQALAAGQQHGYGLAERQWKRSALPLLKKGEAYSAVRIRLLGSGWRPPTTTDKAQCEDGDGRCQGRPEVQACSGTGKADCLFCWEKDGRFVVVTTVYDPPIVDTIDRRKSCRF